MNTMALIHAGELITAKSKGPKSGKAMQDLGLIRDGALVWEDGLIKDVGTTAEILKKHKPKNILDAQGRLVAPGFVDCHTHLVFAGSRHEEYALKVAGKNCAHLPEGGGIRYSAAFTRKASFDFLFEKAMRDLDRMLAHGTTTVEAKSGYGLSETHELKILEVQRQLQKSHPVDLISTFLGAHTVPDEYKDSRHLYVNLIKLLMMPKAARLAEFCDVFCDPLGFAPQEAREILIEAKRCGMGIKIHAEQTARSGGAELAASLGAVSADHLDFASRRDLERLKRAGTVAVLLPGVTFHLMEFSKKTPASLILDAGLPLALATDYNPGTSPMLSMLEAARMAVRLYRFSYAQALNAATLNAAYAIGRGQLIGSLEPGKQADIVLYDCETHGELLHSFGFNRVHTVIKKGRIVVQNQQITWRKL